MNESNLTNNVVLKAKGTVYMTSTPKYKEPYMYWFEIICKHSRIGKLLYV